MTEQRGQTLAAGLTAYDEQEEVDEDDSQETPVAAATPVAANKADEAAGRDRAAARRSDSKAEQEPKQPEEFASIEQILAWVRGGKMAGRVDGPSAAEAPGQPGTVRKPAVTDRRAANSDE
jgi:hypothetical protein